MVISSIKKLFQNHFFPHLEVLFELQLKIIRRLEWMLQQHGIHCFGYKISVLKNKMKRKFIKTRWVQNQCRNWHELIISVPLVSRASFTCCWEKGRPVQGIFLLVCKVLLHSNPLCYASAYFIGLLHTSNWKFTWCVFLAWGFCKIIVI